MITIATGRHEGLRTEVRGFAEMAADEGDGTARVERMALDAVLTALAGMGQRPIDPLEALLVPPQPRLRDAVQQRQRRSILQLALLARAEELDDCGVMAGCR
jgi:hypothetical protein